MATVYCNRKNDYSNLIFKGFVQLITSDNDNGVTELSTFVENREWLSWDYNARPVLLVVSGGLGEDRKELATERTNEMFRRLSPFVDKIFYRYSRAEDWNEWRGERVI